MQTDEKEKKLEKDFESEDGFSFYSFLFSF